MAFTPFTKEDQPTMENFNEKFLSAILEGKTQALDEGVKFATGSYVGTGEYGASNPNSITFSFVPKIWGIFDGNMRMYFGSYTDVTIGVWGVSTDINITNNAPCACPVTYNGTTVSWYSDYSSNQAQYQLNLSGHTYYYFAIG